MNNEVIVDRGLVNENLEPWQQYVVDNEITKIKVYNELKGE